MTLSGGVSTPMGEPIFLFMFRGYRRSDEDFSAKCKFSIFAFQRYDSLEHHLVLKVEERLKRDVGDDFASVFDDHRGGILFFLYFTLHLVSFDEFGEYIDLRGKGMHLIVLCLAYRSKSKAIIIIIVG